MAFEHDQPRGRILINTVWVLFAIAVGCLVVNALAFLLAVQEVMQAVVAVIGEEQAAALRRLGATNPWLNLSYVAIFALAAYVLTLIRRLFRGPRVDLILSPSGAWRLYAIVGSIAAIEAISTVTRYVVVQDRIGYLRPVNIAAILCLIVLAYMYHRAVKYNEYNKGTV